MSQLAQNISKAWVAFLEVDSVGLNFRNDRFRYMEAFVNV